MKERENKTRKRKINVDGLLEKEKGKENGKERKSEKITCRQRRKRNKIKEKEKATECEV